MNIKLLCKFSCAVWLMLLACTTLYAQERKITGKIVDQQDHKPLPGVNVSVKGKPSNVSTNADGVYTIQVNSNSDLLVFSYIGFVRQTIPVGTQSNIDVTMVSDNKGLDEVVVVGYGEQKKIHLTGAIATIDTKQIQDIPVTDLASSLRGQIPGISIGGGNTRPQGNSTTITVRNPTFLAKDAAATPLFIIDDVFRDQAAFNALDQTEVESISILKDAAAAIYGIAGSNGAVIVRTKRGKSGAPKVSYSGSVGFSNAADLPTMLNGYQQVLYLNDVNKEGQLSNGHKIDEHGYIDESSTNKLTAYYTPDELAYFQDPAHSTDWLRQAFKTAAVQRHTLSISGGNDKVTYFANTSYVNQNSNFDGASSNRWTYRASVDAKVAAGLKVALSLSGNISNSKIYYFKQGGESQDNDFKILTSAPQYTQFYYNGLPTLISGAAGNSSNTNLLENFNYFAALATNDYSLNRPTTLNINPTITYDVPFIKGLRLAGNYNRQITNTFGKQVGTNYDVYQFAGLGENHHIIGGDIINKIKQKNGDFIRLTPKYDNDYELNATVSYHHKFGKHEISVLGVYEQQEKSSDGVSAYVEGVLPGGYDNQNFAIGAQNSSETVSNFGRQAYAGRVNYNYADKYLLEALIRADGNTHFAPGHRWGYFPSVSAGWVVSQEGFFKDNIKFMDFLKIRGSVGFLGSDATKPYLYAENYNFGQQQHAAVFGGNGDRGLSIFQNVALANANTRWDNDTKMNGGLDMQFLKSRLGVTADAYLDHHYNMLATLTSSSPLTVGAAVPSENYATINSFGYELSVSWKDNIGKDLSYYVSPWLSWNDNKVIRIDQSPGIVGTFEDEIGRSSDMGFEGYKYAGFFRTQADVNTYLSAHPGYTLDGVTPKPGMLYYEDIRGKKNPSAPGGYDGPDGIIDGNDMTYLTNRASNHYGGGFNFGGTYKNFTVQVVTSLSWGGQGAIETAAINPKKAFSGATQTANRPSIWAPGSYWTRDNTNAALPSPYFIDDFGMNDVASDFWFKSSLQFRMTNFNLSYAVPKKFASKLGVSDIRLYANVTNPVNFYNPYSYRDNGVSTYMDYPTVRSYTFGLNVGF